VDIHQSLKVVKATCGVMGRRALRRHILWNC
jgi:hypothetical protein